MGSKTKIKILTKQVILILVIPIAFHRGVFGQNSIPPPAAPTGPTSADSMYKFQLKSKLNIKEVSLFNYGTLKFWELIAKTNRIPPPYQLFLGQVLLLPKKPTVTPKEGALAVAKYRRALKELTGGLRLYGKFFRIQVGIGGAITGYFDKIGGDLTSVTGTGTLPLFRLDSSIWISQNFHLALSLPFEIGLQGKTASTSFSPWIETGLRIGRPAGWSLESKNGFWDWGVEFSPTWQMLSQPTPNRSDALDILAYTLRTQNYFWLTLTPSFALAFGRGFGTEVRPFVSLSVFGISTAAAGDTTPNSLPPFKGMRFGGNIEQSIFTLFGITLGGSYWTNSTAAGEPISGFDLHGLINFHY